jgi:hypothetical protein
MNDRGNLYAVFVAIRKSYEYSVISSPENVESGNFLAYTAAITGLE